MLSERTARIVGQALPPAGIEWFDKLSEGHATACPGRAEARPSATRLFEAIAFRLIRLDEGRDL